MNIITWNIQAALGVDGQVNINRIAQVIKSMGEADVICLQEITREKQYNSSEKQMKHTGLADDLASHFPDYEMFYGPAIDRIETPGRYYFGNMILSKLPVASVFMHRLPQPPDPTTRTMARQATEITVEYNNNPVRIITTHLEFFATEQRTAQLQYLTRYVTECRLRFEQPSPTGEGSYVAPPETDRTIVCGDFNLEADTDHYHFLTCESSEFTDAWNIAHDDMTHEPTCGIYDHIQWPNGKHCRDFFFVSSALTSAVKEVIVETDTQASDHQPVKLVLK